MEAAAGKGEASAASQSAECFSCYMTQKSKSRNVLASPLGEEGHEVAKGCTRVRMIMILLFYVSSPLKGKRLTTFCASLRSGGRRLAVRKMIECHIPAQTRTPFPASRDFPSRGNEGHGEKNRRVIYFMYHSGVSPFGGCATTFPPQFGGAAKGKRLNGQARRLLRPTWRSYAGPPQGTTRLREVMYS